MARHDLKRTSRAGQAALLVLILAAAGGLGLFAFRTRGKPAVPVDLPRTVVTRTDLRSIVRTNGVVESSEKTLIKCQIENIAFYSSGRRLNMGGSSTIIEVVPDGSMVREGDVLCRLDASAYEELVRQQSIEVQTERSEVQAARLDLESNEVQLREYRDGQLEQLRERYQGQIALAISERERTRDRLTWSERMVELGYLPSSRLTSERQLFQRAEISLNEAQLAFDNLVKYKAPKMILSLESQIYNSEVRLSYRETRLKRDEEQLAKYQEQVELCTIRAPHDGFLIYANKRGDETQIEPGVTVRQNQELFYLPDLSQMEVQADLHETVVSRIHAGMPARVRVEALPNVELEGQVVAVDPLPQSRRSWAQSEDVKNFSGRIQLDVIPAGLLPGMTAELEILTASKNNALVVPPQALSVQDGRDVCFVTTSTGRVERRTVTLGEYHPEMIEILDGLAEGEQVVLAPDRIDPALVVDVSPPPKPPVAEPEAVFAAAPEPVQPTL